MKKSTFTHEISVTGTQGQKKAKVVVTMNYSTKNINETHAVMHDEFSKQVPVHKIEVFLEFSHPGSVWKDSLEIVGEDRVLDELRMLLNSTKKQLRFSANYVEKTFQEKINDVFLNFDL